MYWTTVYGELFVFCFAIKLDWSTGVRVTELNVPELADPRDSLALGCAYDLGGEELHSVKWYKDEQEFFRYTPRQQPHVMSFPMAGVHLEQQQSMACDTRQCSVRLTRLSTAHSSGAYKCEVSTEAPKFRVGFRAGNVTVAAVGRAEPQVQGVREVYAPGDLVQASCMAQAADPAPTITWLLNGKPAPIIAVSQQRVSPPDKHGLVVASRDLRFHAERRHFVAPDHRLQLMCVAAPPPGVPAPSVASVPAIARLFDPQTSTHQQQRDVLGNQMLAWPSSSDRTFQLNVWLTIWTICLLLF